MVRALWNGAVIAESDDTVVVEGNHYFPPDSVRRDLLMPSTTNTTCPWKGRASYYSIEVNGQVNRDAAWYYPNPSAAAAAIEGRIAFWRGVKIVDQASGSRRRSLFDRVRRGSRDGAGGHATAAPDTGRSTPLAATHQVDNDSHLLDADDESFASTVDGQVAVVDFWAPWCGPCKALHPMLDELAGAHADSGVRFVRVDVDTSPDVATRFKVMSIPTLVVLADGNELERQVGVPNRRRLEELVLAAVGRVTDRTNGRSTP